jgi:hypothetical protein
MGDILFGVFVCFGFFVAAVLAMVVLGIRDFTERRALEESRSLDERIRSIKESAAFMVQQFERVAERNKSQGNIEWIPVVIKYHRQLEALAASEATTSDEAAALAEDAARYEREHRLKGINVSEQAGKLATLIQRRNQERPEPV